MCKSQQVLLISRDGKIKSNIEHILNNGINILTTLYTMSDAVEASAMYGYDMLIVDSNTYPICEDMLSLFKKQTFYIPLIFVLSNNYKSIQSKYAVYVGFDDLTAISECISKLKMQKESPYPFSDSFMRDSISRILLKLGFNPKYKGFKYLTEMIYRIISVDNVSKSYKKAIYPFIARLYNTSPESVERDVRNIINIGTKNSFLLNSINFNPSFNPTTRNVVNHLVLHVTSLI